MSQMVETMNYGGKDAGAAVALHALCVLSSDKWVVAGATALGVGTARVQAFASGDPMTLSLLNGPGTKKMIANAAITSGVEVFAAASGKVAPAGTVSVGTAFQAAAADGDIIEVYHP